MDEAIELNELELEEEEEEPEEEGPESLALAPEADCDPLIKQDEVEPLKTAGERIFLKLENDMALELQSSIFPIHTLIDLALQTRAYLNKTRTNGTKKDLVGVG